MEILDEQFFSCPYCGSSVSITIETNCGGQQYIEDCEVCCQPIEIQYKVLDGRICQFSARRGND
jgi:transcription elongation factor Elf1